MLVQIHLPPNCIRLREADFAKHPLKIKTELMIALIKKFDTSLHRAAPFLLSAGAILLLGILIYWRTLTIFYAPYSLIATPKPTPAWAATLFSLRWFVVVFSAFLFCLFLYIEIRLHTLTNIFRFLLTHRVWSVITLVVLTLVGRSYFFLPGRLALGDNSNVAFNIWAMRYWIETGNGGVFWSNYALMGSPFSQFHLSLYYYFGGLIDLLIRDPYLSNKIVGMIAHIAMTYSMFIYVRHLTRSIWSGLFSAAIWSTAFFHYHHFIGVGTIVASLVIAFLPLQLYWFETSLGRGVFTRSRAMLALTIGVQIWAHQLYGMWGVAFLLAYIVVRVTSRYLPLPYRRTSDGGGWVGVKEIFITTLWSGIGVLIGIYKILPVIAEGSLVGVSNLFASRFEMPIIKLQQILTFNDSFLNPDWQGGYIGPVLLIISIVGVMLVIINRASRFSGLVAWFAITAILSFAPYYAPDLFDRFWQNIPLGEFVYAVKTPGRYLFFFEFAVTALCGVAIKQLSAGLMHFNHEWHEYTNLTNKKNKKYSHHSPIRLIRDGVFLFRIKRPRAVRGWISTVSIFGGAMIMIYMIYLSLIVNSLIPDSWTSQTPKRGEALAWIKQNGDGTSRVIDVVSQWSVWQAYEVAAYSGQPSYFNHKEEAQASLQSALTLIDWLKRDLKAGQIQPATLNLVYLLDARYILGHKANISNFAPAFQDELYSVWLAPHSIIVASDRLTSTRDSDSLETIFADMKIDSERNVINGIPVKDRDAPPLKIDSPLRVSVIAHELQPQYAKITFDLNAEAYVQLGYSYYPYLNVLLDGKKVEAFPTSLQLIALKVPAGKHTIELVPYLSSIRIVSLLIGLVATLFSLLVVFFRD